MNEYIPGLKVPEKDVCHYHIYLKDSSSARASEILAAATALHTPWTKDYIWQDQGFSLLIVSGASSTPGAGDSFLTGSTRFGDCIEDEWFIVWILTELSRQCRDIFVQVTDTDGEFLLIESAMHLPRWLDPDTAVNRAWIRDGQFVIIPPTPTEILNKQCPALTIDQALHHLKSGKQVLHAKSIENDALARIKKYPEQLRREIHRVSCTVPRVLTTLLHHEPALIAPLAVAYYQRDEGDIARFAQGQSRLTSLEVEDMVQTTVRFTRTLYAQLIGSKFVVPGWYPAALGDKAAHEIGCKLVCGLTVAHDVRLSSALDRARTTPVSDDEITSWHEEPDSDDYLHVNFDELEDVLAGNDRSTEHEENEASDETIKKMVEQMQKFMNTDSTFEGAEFSGEDDDDNDDEEEDDDDDDDDDDDEDGYDEYDEEDVEDGFGDEDADFMDFLRAPVSGSSALEALRTLQAETQAEPQVNIMDDNHGEKDEEEEEIGDLNAYMAAMDAELSSHGLSALETTNRSIDKSVDDEDLNIDFAMAKNMLASLQSSGGMSGPAAGLLGQMGISLPRDDDDDHDDESDASLD